MLCRVLCVLLFVAWTGEWPLDRDDMLYCGLWRSPFQVFAPLFVSVPGINLFPWQLMFFAMAPPCFLAPGAFRRRAWILDLAIAASLASIAVTFLWGWMRGGSAYHAYYQLWRFLAGLLLALMLQSAIRKPKDLKALAYTILIAALVRGTLAMYFYWAIVRERIDPPPPHMTTHDDTLLFICAILIVLAWSVARGGAKAWLAAAAASLHLLYAIILNNRRLAWIELGARAPVDVLPAPACEEAPPHALGASRRARGSRLCGSRVGPGRGRVRSRQGAQRLQAATRTRPAWPDRRRSETSSTPSRPPATLSWGPAGGSRTWRRPASTRTSGGPSSCTLIYPTTPSSGWRYSADSSGSPASGWWCRRRPSSRRGATWGPLGRSSRAAAMTILCLLPAYGVQCYGDIGFQSMTSGLLLGVAMGSAGKLAVWAESSRRGRDGRPAGS